MKLFSFFFFCCFFLTQTTNIFSCFSLKKTMFWVVIRKCSTKELYSQTVQCLCTIPWFAIKLYSQKILLVQYLDIQWFHTHRQYYYYYYCPLIRKDIVLTASIISTSPWCSKILYLQPASISAVTCWAKNLGQYYEKTTFVCKDNVFTASISFT